jgi:hypothetical protein
MRGFGISLLLLALFFAGVDGFRMRERTVTPGATTTEAAATPSDNTGVHISDFGVGIGPK